MSSNLRKSSFLLISVFFVFVLYGCGGGGSLSPNPYDEPSVVTLSIDNNYQVVDPDGVTRIPITVAVFKDNGDPASDVKVEISSDPNIGVFDAYSKTTRDGKAVFYYTVPNYDTVSMSGVNSVTIKAAVAGHDIAGSCTVYFKIYASRIVATIPDNSTILPADSDIVVPITVFAYRSDGAPLSGVNIMATVTPNIGSFDNLYVTTDDGGIAKFSYRLPSREDALKAGADHVILSFKSADDGTTASVNIAFDNVRIGNGVPAAIMLSAQPSMIFTSTVGSGPKVAQITAKVVDSSGAPVNGGYTVKFTLLKAPNGTYITPAEVPVEDGIAVTSVISGSESGSVLVQAEVVGESAVISSSAVLYIAVGQPSSITLVESGKVVAQDDNGTRSENIYALVKDIDGNPVADGTVVYFTLEDTCGGLIQSKSSTINGVATALLTYPAQCIWKTYKIYAETSGDGIEGSLSAIYPAVNPVILTLSGPTTVSPSGDNVTIVALLKDNGGNYANNQGLPIDNASIMFSSSVDNVTFVPINKVGTDINGESSIKVEIPALPDNITSRDIIITGQSGTAIGVLKITQQTQ